MAYTTINLLKACEKGLSKEQPNKPNEFKRAKLHQMRATMRKKGNRK